MTVVPPASASLDSAGSSATVLEPRAVGALTGIFHVPAYQRGYRWTKHEVKQLLDDLWTACDHTRDADYWLQPVVVKAMGSAERESAAGLVDTPRWELIDGQQRLTTLYLILQHLQHLHCATAHPFADVPYQVEYATRERSRAFLNTLGKADGSAKAECSKNIDFHHLYQAHLCIESWFDKCLQEASEVQQRPLPEFAAFILKRAKVLWYQVPADAVSTDIFTRLNVGRIRLTNAELFKALLLSRRQGSPGQSDRRHEIAAQWDAMERDLQVPDLWAFITGRPSPEEDPRYATRITLLLDVLARQLLRNGGKQQGESHEFQTFEVLQAELAKQVDGNEEGVGTGATLSLWEQVVDLHGLIWGWYQDHDAYHRVGYLIAVGGGTSSGKKPPLDQLICQARIERKGKFKDQTLVKLINDRLDLSADSLSKLTYDSNAQCNRVLLLLNVETMRRRQVVTERFAFSRHASTAWTLEHIHAQNAEALTKAGQWLVWLEAHQRVLESMKKGDAGRDGGADSTGREEKPTELEAAIAEAKNGTLKGEKFRTLSEAVLEFLSRDRGHDVHAIANLALLGSGENSKLSNSAFELKRNEVLAMVANGASIPVCTQMVFLKSFPDADVHQIHFWSKGDRDAYLKYITDTLKDYLSVGVDTGAEVGVGAGTESQK